jgi:predicted component of type VI protein secretion system
VGTLRVYRGDQFVAPFELGEGRTRIGRGTDNHLVLEDPDKQVSRSHAEIWHDRGRYVIADLNSQNGVWIGERQIKTEETLPVNAPVTIGPYRLILMPDEKPAAAATDELEAVDVTGRREAYVEPTQLLEPAETVPPASQRSHPPKPAAQSQVAPPARTQTGKSPAPAAKSRSNTIPIIAAVAALLVLGIVAVVMFRKPANTGTETAANTTTVPPATTSIPATATPTPEEVFLDHYGKAQAFIQQSNKASAREENAAALAALPDDPRGVAQRTAIDAMPEPGAQPAQPAVAEGAPPPNTAPPKPAAPPLAETLRVQPRPGESEKERALRERNARAQLDEGRKALADRQFDAAITALQGALATSGRGDFGAQPNEAGLMLRQARNGKAAAEAAQRHANAQRLVDEAKAAAGSDIVTALQKLRDARNLDAEIDGATELSNSLTEQARAQGESAVSSARNFDARNRNEQAIKEYERAVRLLEFVPGHKDLAFARQRLADLRGGK